MKRAHVMIVDDEVSIREVLTDFLLAWGCVVTTAESGVAALELLATVRPDLVLLDVSMPGLDGLGTLRQIVVRDPSLPVVMVTGVGDRETAATALTIGARDYVLKPLRPEYLEEVLSIQLQEATPLDDVLELGAADAILTVDLTTYGPLGGEQPPIGDGGAA
jgi:DNA-binding response OmpR family regulator